MMCRQCMWDQKQCVCKDKPGEWAPDAMNSTKSTCAEEVTGPHHGTPKMKKVPMSGSVLAGSRRVTCQMAPKPPTIEESEVEEIDRSKVRTKSESLDSRSDPIVSS